MPKNIEGTLHKAHIKGGSHLSFQLKNEEGIIQIKSSKALLSFLEKKSWFDDICSQTFEKKQTMVRVTEVNKANIETQTLYWLTQNSECIFSNEINVIGKRRGRDDESINLIE